MASIPIYRTSDGAEDTLPFLVAVVPTSADESTSSSSQYDHASSSKHRQQQPTPTTVAFESLTDLRQEISRRLDITDQGLVLFVSGLPKRPSTTAVSTGGSVKSLSAPQKGFAEQLGETAFEHMCEFLEARAVAEQRRQHDNDDTPSDDDADNDHNSSRGLPPAPPVTIWCFDRDSFSSDPVTFSASLEESLVLADFLPRSPPPPPPSSSTSVAGPSRWDRSSATSAVAAQGHIHAHEAWSQAYLPFEALAERAEELVRATRVQSRALEVATENLGLHLELLKRGTGKEEQEGKEEEESEDEDEDHGRRQSSDKTWKQRRRRRRSGSAFKPGSNAAATAAGGGGAAGGWMAFAATVRSELDREARLVGGHGKTGEGGAAATSSWGMEDDMRLISRIKVHPCFLGGASAASTGGTSAAGPSSTPSRRRSSAETSRPVSVVSDAITPIVKSKTLGDFVNATKMRTVLESCLRSYDDHRTRYAALQGDLDRLEAATDEIVRSVAGLVEHVEHEVEDALDEVRAIVAEAEGILGDRDRLEVDTLSAWQALQTLDGNLRESVTSLTHLKNDFTLQLHIHLHQISIQQSTIASLPPSMATFEELLLSTRTQARTGFPHLARLHDMLHAYGAACIEVLWRKKVSAVMLDGAREMAEEVAEWLNREKARRKTFEGEVLTVLPYEVDLLGKAAKSGPRLELNAAGGGEDIAGWQFGDEDLQALMDDIRRLRDEFQTSTDLRWVYDDLEDLRQEMDASVEDLQQRFSRISPDAAHADELGRLRSLIDERDIALAEAQSRDRLREEELEALRNKLASETSRLGQATQEALLASRELEEERQLRRDEQRQIQTLQSERSQILQGLSDARADEESLAVELAKLQAELTSTLAALEDTRQERDEVLHEQASAAERMMRDHLVEATGDRAVLEHQNATLTKALEDLRINSEAQVTAVRNENARECNGLKAELGLAKAQLRDAQKARTTMVDGLRQLKDAVTEAEHERDRHQRFGRDAIKVASSFYDCVARLHAAIQSSATISGSTSLAPENAPAAASAPATTTTNVDEKVLETELATFQAYDLVAFGEAVARTMSLVKKWQKSCKQYRERAKEKIAFANFVKGDLALFLPTRNATSRVWAAFNISSPHNFLKPTPEIAEQIQYREWVVARITKIDEDVVDSNRPDSNPYGLAEGLRYHVLRVESYTPPPPRPRRSTSTGGQSVNDPRFTPLERAMASDTKTDYFQASTSAPKQLTSPQLRAQQQSLEGATPITIRNRPPSVASSAGSSFSRGLHYAPSKAASTTAVVNVASSPLAKGNATPAAGPPPFATQTTTAPTQIPGSPNIGHRLSTSPLGVSPGALDILRRFEKGRGMAATSPTT